MGNGILEAIGIGKSFGAVRALDNVSFTAVPGEIHALIGENGAGKSTLLKILNGCYAHGSFEGKIMIDGEEQRFISPHDALNKGIGFVPQEIDVLNELSVAENIFVGNLGGKVISLNKTFERAKKLLEEYHINLDPRQRVGLLSIGQKQQLMILRALAHDPKVLILDESTSALGEDDVEKLFWIVQQLKQRQKAIVFVTHKLDEIFRLTDKATILRDGHLIRTVPKEKYTKDGIISDMVGREVKNVYPVRDCKIGKEILQVRELTVDHPRIRNRNLIHNISFTLHEGEVLGLGGLVGSGRSETLETLFGCHPVKSGSIMLEGREVRFRSPAQALECGIAYVSEDRKSTGLLLKNNIRVNVTISDLKSVCEGPLLSAGKERERAQELKTQLLIKAPSVETRVTQLSGGNQQKVLLAKALNSKPKIILMDEPTKGIDVGAKNEIYNLINMLAAQGISIVLVSSEMQELIALSDRIVVLDGGEVCGELSKEEATQERIMEMISLYKGEK